MSGERLSLQKDSWSPCLGRYSWYLPGHTWSNTTTPPPPSAQQLIFLAISTSLGFSPSHIIVAENNLERKKINHQHTRISILFAGLYNNPKHHVINQWPCDDSAPHWTAKSRSQNLTDSSLDLFCAKWAKDATLQRAVSILSQSPPYTSYGQPCCSSAESSTKGYLRC